MNDIKLRIMLVMTMLFTGAVITNHCFASDIVTYAGGSGNDTFNDFIQISDGTFLVCGDTDDIEWVESKAENLKCMEELAGLENSRGTDKYAFIMRLSNDMSRIIDFVYLPKGAAESIRFMKTTNVPGDKTGDLYISGDINHTGIFSNNQRPIKVFIARLNHNFLDGIPSAFVWQHSFWSENYVSDYHPWDVGSDGRVILAEGQAHNADYGAILALNAQTGKYDIVPRWRNHRFNLHRIQTTPGKLRDDFIEGDFWGYPEDHKPNLTQVNAYERDNDFNVVKDTDGNPIITATGDSIGNILYSRIYTKWTGGADLRSWTQEEFDLWQPDENGSFKKGKYPWDMMFSTPCNPADIAGSTKQNEKGYTRYRTQGGSKAILGTSSITIDRRTNDFYIGMNISSKLPDGDLPDFEPVVIAYSKDGGIKWWSRLYHETVGGTPVYENGVLKDVTGYTTNTSTPDQYVDAIAIDYSLPAENGNILVNARAHGNNVENLWEGNTIAANPGANGFKNGFSGNNGNIHLSWLGRMKTDNGQLLASTYVAEAADDAEFTGSPLSDPNLDGWKNPNNGWLKLNTTQLQKNTMKVSADGFPVIVGTGRRTITTANANQRMRKPEEGKSGWNSFVRVYKPDLSLPLYSSLASGIIDEDGDGGDNMEIKNVWKTRDGVVVVGHTKVGTDGMPQGNDINLSTIPSWGKDKREGQDAVLFYFRADNIENNGDGYDDNETNSVADIKDLCPALTLNDGTILLTSSENTEFTIYASNGGVVSTGKTNVPVDISHLSKGVYIIRYNIYSFKIVR